MRVILLVFEQNTKAIYFIHDGKVCQLCACNSRGMSATVPWEYVCNSGGMSATVGVCSMQVKIIKL